MSKLVLVFVVALALSTPAMAIDIGCSTATSWWPEGTAQTEMQEIADSVPVSVEIFTSSDEDALADWVADHTGNGQSDLLILCGRFPTSIYPGGNAQPDGSLAELFLDDGNCIINTGDWMFYVSNPNNGGDGLANMMDIPGISMSDPIVDVTPTAEGQLYTPSFEGFSPSRPWHLEQVTGDWEVELILGLNDDGTRADPAIMHNTVTGGRLGTFFQVADVLLDERSVVISEWINNWYLQNAAPSLTARGPAPASEAVDVPRDVVLSWTPGPSAVAHDVYFGTVFDDVNDASRADPRNVLVSQGQSAENYDPDGLLDFSTTYYWRVDEVNGAPDNTIFKGNVWSFTAEPFAYAIENVIASSNLTPDAGAGPENTVNGSGLNANGEHSVGSTDMWLGSANGADPMYIQFEFDQIYKLHEMLVWNYNVQFELILGFGTKDVTVEYSEDGTNWTTLGDVELAQATAAANYAANTTVDFGGVGAKYVRFIINSGWGMLPQYGLSEVRFMYIPAQAREPQPDDGATDVSINTALAWRAGRDAVSHEVSIGTDPAALSAGAAVDGRSYDPGVLDLDMTYYWQVSAIQDTESWQGPLWSFATQAYLVVDDFESYDDEENRIYDNWVDGWVNDTGSTVGYLQEPFAERTIVNSGNQSMPLQYDNAGVATSEAEFSLSQDWTTSGIQSLVLYFYGDAGNSGGQLYVKINSTKILYDGSAANLAAPSWHLWSIDLAASGASLSNVNSLTIGIEGAGASGILYIDDIRLYPEVLAYHRLPDITAAGDTVVGVPDDGDWPAAEYPDLAIDDDVNTKYLHRKGGAMPTGFQVTPAAGATIVTGLTFTTANDAPTRDPISFELSGSNAGIDGPYELIAAGDIVDFAGATEWPRFTKNATLITFDNDVAYTNYQIVFPTLRGESETLMQIAEVELIGETSP